MRGPNRMVAVVVATTLAIIASLVTLTIAVAAPGKGLQRAAATSTSLPSTTCAESGGTRTCNLWADEGTLSLPGGGSPVDIWGYSMSPGGPFSLPGPVIVANEGETLEVVLHNALGEPTSLAIPGLSGLAGDTEGALPNASKTYAIPDIPPGTYLYEAGLTAGGDKQVALGLYGALVVRPTALAGSAYGTVATAFDQEELIVISEIDPVLHAAPASFDMRDYHPTYWLMNGKAYPDTEAIDAPGGARVLFRWVNAGLENQPVGSFSLYQQVVGAGGRALPYAHSVLAETLAAGTTLDAIASIPVGLIPGTRYAIASAALHLDNAGVGPAGGRVPFGGMLTFLTVSSAGVDTAGPATTMSLSATLTNDSSGVTITASGDDSGSGSSIVDAGESFIGGGCVNGGGTAMTVDGPQGVVTNFTAALGSLVEGDHAVIAHTHDSAGFWGACTSPAILRVDTTGPASSDVAAAPNPTNGAASVTLSASAADPVSGGVNSAVAAAEWFENPLTAEGTGTAMAAGDGAFDSPTEGVTATIDVNGWTLGSHDLYVRARDAAGNWGAPISTALEVNDVIFLDGVEAGTFSSWSAKVGTATNPSISPSAAMAGSSLGVSVGLGGGAAAYVQDDRPTGEGSYHARFYYNPNGWQPNGSSANGQHAILTGRDSASQTVFEVQTRKTSGKKGRFEVRLVVAKTKGSSATDWFAVTDGSAHSIEIAWQRSASASASLYVDGVLKKTMTGMNTIGRSLDRVQLGVQSLPTQATGTVYLDEFKSSRFTYIGP